MRVLITRPREDGEALGARLAAMGHRALLAPLLQPRWFDGPPLDLGGIAAVVATSANGVRALARRTGRRDLPVFAVGPQTSAQAQAEGFARVENADGDAAELAAAIPGWLAPGAGTLLHVCGTDAPGALAQSLERQGYTVRRENLYAIETLALQPEAAAALRAGAIDAALFFSPRSAVLFAQASAAMALTRVTALCISPATAQALPPDRFAAVRIAARPNQEALLALLPAP